MNQETMAPLNWHVHKHRIKEEVIFQRLIKEPALSKCEVGALKDLSRDLYIMLSNIDMDLENKESSFMVTDEIANGKWFITNMMADYLFKEKS